MWELLPDYLAVTIAKAQAEEFLEKAQESPNAIRGVAGSVRGTPSTKRGVKSSV